MKLYLIKTGSQEMYVVSPSFEIACSYIKELMLKRHQVVDIDSTVKLAETKTVNRYGPFLISTTDPYEYYLPKPTMDLNG